MLHWRSGWGVGCVALVIVVTSVVVASAQDESQVDQFLDQCRRNIRQTPVDGQRSCRDAIAHAQMAFFPSQYVQQRRAAFLLLGDSYFNGGRIQDAVAQLDSVEGLGPDAEELGKVEALRGEVERSFRPLRITIRDRRIPLLSYISGVDIDFVYPRRLSKAQSNRIEILRDETIGREDEFQFVAFDEVGQAYMEIAFFPVITFSGRSVGYSLIVEGRRRYRFGFSQVDSSAVQIFWEDDAGWELVERVPDGIVKVELPDKYTFDINTDGTPQVVKGGGVQHVYVPAAAETELTLATSEDHRWERFYNVALYALVTITGGSALLGAR
jgi:hypothetical protein